MKTPLLQDFGPPPGPREVRFPLTVAMVPLRWKCGPHHSPWEETDQESFSKKEKLLFLGEALKQLWQIWILTPQNQYQPSRQPWQLSSAPAGMLYLWVCPWKQRAAINYQTDEVDLKNCYWSDSQCRNLCHLLLAFLHRHRVTTTHLAQTDSELSLLQGEFVLVHRPRPDGRVLVTQESSGHTGLFHSSVLQALEKLSWLCSVTVGV